VHGTALARTQGRTGAWRSTRTRALENWLTRHRPAGHGARLRSRCSRSLRTRRRWRRRFVHRTRAGLRHNHPTNWLLGRRRSCRPRRSSTRCRLRRARSLHRRRHHLGGCTLNRRRRRRARRCGRSYRRRCGRCCRHRLTRRRRRSRRRSCNSRRCSGRDFSRWRRRNHRARGRHRSRRCGSGRNRRMRWRRDRRTRRCSGRGWRGLAIDRLQYVTGLGNVREIYLGPYTIIRTRSTAAPARSRLRFRSGLKVLAHSLRFIFFDGAGMGFLLSDTYQG